MKKIILESLLICLIFSQISIASISFSSIKSGLSKIVKNFKKEPPVIVLPLVLGTPVYLALIHELGHALTAKLLLGAPIDISIGPKYKKNSLSDLTTENIGLNKVLLKVGGIKFYSFFSDGGLTSFRLKDEVSPYKKLAIYASGPIAEYCADIGLYLALKKLLKNKKTNLTFARNFLLLNSLISIYKNLVPNKADKNDGDRIFSYLKEIFQK